jgi:hypothetical protein
MPSASSEKSLFDAQLCRRTVKSTVARKTPVTREALDEQIRQLEDKIRSSLERKAFSECGPLQDELDAIKLKQTNLPTTEQLKEAVTRAQAAVAVAEANRDFGAAAQAQEILKEAQRNLEDVSMSMNPPVFGAFPSKRVDGIATRADLDAKILQAINDLRRTEASQKSERALDLQREISRLELLRPSYPTADEIEVKLSEANEILSFVKSDSHACAYISDIIDSWEKALAEEQKSAPAMADTGASRMARFVSSAGDETVFQSRRDLEAEIERRTQLISLAASAKQYSQAEGLQRDVDDLTKLRQAMPSIEELQSRIDELNADMGEAISAKRYAMADALHAEMDTLQQALAREKSLAATAAQTDVPIAGFEVNVPYASIGTGSTDTSVSSGSISGNARPVSRLRPGKPVRVFSDDSALSAGKLLSRKRVAAGTSASSRTRNTCC